MSDLQEWGRECRKNFEDFGFSVSYDVFKQLGFYVYYLGGKGGSAKIYWPKNGTVLVSKTKVPPPIGVSEWKKFSTHDFDKMRDYILE